uniref:Uncharacterized protein n=1 Tax=Brassica oleracea TaxID=3712 RepID=A0A3P6GF49_BRAOL|nr:unnamed protein product [Brassica oleracea]
MRLLRQPRFLGHTPSTSPRRPPLLLHALPPPQPSDVVLPPPATILLRHGISLAASLAPTEAPTLTSNAPATTTQFPLVTSVLLAGTLSPSPSSVLSSTPTAAVCAFKMEAERKGKEGAVAKKRAREALEYFVKLYEKARSDVDKLREKPPLSSPAVIKSRNRNRVLPRMAI